MSATSIRGISRDSLTRPIVQVSLDLVSLDEALARAAVAMAAGADWLEVGTPLVVAEGARAVRALRREFPGIPIVADLKVMDGGYFEARAMADAGADALVVMSRATDATLERARAGGEEFEIAVMGDDLGEPDPVAAALRMERLGVDIVIHHTGFDERGREPALSPLTALPQVVAATTLPVQAVGGLSIDQAAGCPGSGAPLVVFGAPLAVDGDSDFVDVDDLPRVFQEAFARVHSAPIRYLATPAEPEHRR